MLRYFIFILATMQGLMAQSTLTQNLTSQKLPPVSGNLSLGHNFNTYEFNDARSKQSLSADLTFNYRLRDAHLLRTYLGGYKEITQDETWNANDGFVAWVNNAFWGKFKKLTIGQQVRAHIPLSRFSRERDSKMTGISIIPVAIWTISPAFMLIYQPQFVKNMHRYQQNRIGVNNVEYSVNQLLVGVWSINDYWYFQPVVGYGRALSYGGYLRDPNYQAAGEIGFSLNQKLTVAAGWSNAGMMRRLEQGNDQNFDLFNNKSTTLYSALYWVF